MGKFELTSVRLSRSLVLPGTRHQGDFVMEHPSWARQLLAARRERDWYQGVLACFELANDPLHGHGTLLLDKRDREHLLALIVRQLKNPVDSELAGRCAEPRSAFDRRLFERLQETGPATSSMQQLHLRLRYEKLLIEVGNTLSVNGGRALFRWLRDRVEKLNALADE